MEIFPVRAFRDNYIWLLVHGHFAVVVDPGDATPVLDYLRQHQLTLLAILITHHHNDHIDGVNGLLQVSKVPVYAPRNEVFPFPHQPVSEGDQIEFAELETSLTVLDVPGHTAVHVAYYGGNCLFCGDTLFGCGCGRILGGSASQLYYSLQKLAALPDTTRVYPAHEYTLSNIAFARMVDPENHDLANREKADKSLISQGQPTLPSTIALEKRTNPFLRCDTAPIQLAISKTDHSSTSSAELTFIALRMLKNHY
jgi:hydroxyacylglutathione hydrolase